MDSPVYKYVCTGQTITCEGLDWFPSMLSRLELKGEMQKLPLKDGWVMVPGVKWEGVPW